jgi:eukaryotic-like serine/threonine-protein kinase
MCKQFKNGLIELAVIAMLIIACQTGSVKLLTPVLPTTTDVVAATDTPEPVSFPSPTELSGPTPIVLREPLWTFTTQGEIWSSPTIQDGVIYFGSDDHFLYALELVKHQVKWKFKTNGLVRSRPAVVDERVYLTSDDNYLYAVDAQRGKEVWRFDLGKALRPRGSLESNEWDYSISSPAVMDGTVFVGSANDNFYAVDASTGKEKWHFQARGPVRSSPAVAEGIVYFGDSYGMLHALDSQTGKEEWYFYTNNGYYAVSSPTVVDGIVYVGNRGMNPALYALTAQNGEQQWHLPFEGSWVDSSAALVDGIVYIGSSDWLRLSAIDAVTGNLKWQFKGSGYMWCSPAVANGMVYIGDTEQYFYAVNAATGQEAWRVQIGKALETVVSAIRPFHGGVVSSSVVADGVVYFGGLDGKLYAVSTVP